MPSLCLGLGGALLGFFMITGGKGVGERISLVAGVASAAVAALPAIAGSAARGGRPGPPVKLRDAALAGFPLLLVALCGNWLFQTIHDLELDFGAPIGLVEGEEVVREVKVAKGQQLSGSVNFRPQLRPTAKQSTETDCVVPALLVITPLVDNSNVGTWRARYGDKISIPITGSARKLQLRLGIEVPGKDVCAVNLEFQDGVLDRRLP